MEVYFESCADFLPKAPLCPRCCAGQPGTCQEMDQGAEGREWPKDGMSTSK